MGDIFKPNLAGTPADTASIKFPVYASPKLDGIRAMIHDDVRSRSMKPIPNDWIQHVLKAPELRGLDGELIVGSPTDPNCMQNCTSNIMSIGKVFDFQFHVFDDFTMSGAPFSERLDSITTRVNEVQSNWFNITTAQRLDGAPSMMTTCPVVLVPQIMVNDEDGLLMFEAQCLGMGFEGVMVRSLHGEYKQGRSTPKEGGLLKIKRFVDAEFIVIGFDEQMKNNNVAMRNELGRTKRSTHKDGLAGKGTLGALQVRHIEADGSYGAIFNIGTGMDDKMRAHIWANQAKYMSAVGTYKSFPIGVLDAPRHPVFKAWRPEWDIS